MQSPFLIWRRWEVLGLLYYGGLLAAAELAYGAPSHLVFLLLALLGGACALTVGSHGAGLIVAYGATFSAFYLLSEAGVGVPAGLHVALGGGSVVLLGCLVRSLRDVRWAWLVLALALGLMVALLSGKAGGQDPMVRWFVVRWGLSPEAAGEWVHWIRKAIHFLTYGFMALGIARGMGSRRFGVGFALAHAIFDEVRQSALSSRTGSFWDVLLDLAGALVLVGMWGRARGK